MNVTRRQTDGQSLQVESGAAIVIKAGGLLNMEGDLALSNTVWEDLRFPAAGINPPGAASDPTRDTTDGRLVFSGSAENIVAIQAQMPHAWAEGTVIRPHIHWSPTGTDTAAVQWRLQYKVANIGEAFPGSWNSATITVTPSGTTDLHEIDGFGDIDMSGKTLSCMLLILLSRLGDVDTSTASVKLNEFDIHYQIGRLGTDEEFTD